MVEEVVGQCWIAAKGDRVTSGLLRSKGQWGRSWTAHRLEGVVVMMVEAGLSWAGLADRSSTHHY